MIFNGFSKKGIEFLKELEHNNTKVWFEDHKYIWEDEIKQQTIQFVEEMGETLQILVPNINFKPKIGGSLFKIYRDVRFSKDKTPIKSKIGIIFWQGSNHRMQSSSFYIHFTKNTYFIASGIRNFKPELLKKYRLYLKNENKRIELYNIIENLKTKGYMFPQYKYKNIPKVLNDYKDDLYIDLSKYGAMYSYIEYKLNDKFYEQDIIDRCFKIYSDMKDLYSWVYEMTLD